MMKLKLSAVVLGVCLVSGVARGQEPFRLSCWSMLGGGASYWGDGPCPYDEITCAKKIPCTEAQRVDQERALDYQGFRLPNSQKEVNEMNAKSDAQAANQRHFEQALHRLVVEDGYTPQGALAEIYRRCRNSTDKNNCGDIP